MSKFYIVPTPIGNLEDITLRAIRILNEVDFILCEDTRETKKLFSLLNLQIDYKKLFSLHKFNESSKLETILTNLKNDKTYALVSDAGTPTINDPGQKLINYLLENKIEVIPLPGPCSFITALSATGIFYKKFVFLGFLEKTKSKIFKQFNYEKDVLNIAFESPHRIFKTLKFIYEEFGDLEITLAREVTKKFEEIKTDMISSFLKRKEIKGELIIFIKFKDGNKK